MITTLSLLFWLIMSDNTYTIEHAKSGRASCRSCKSKIDKGDLRIGFHGTNGEYEVTYWYHTQCFNLPRKLSTGANKITPQDFVETQLQDKTDDHVLQTKGAEIAEQIASKKKKASDTATDETKHPSQIQQLRQAWKEREEEEGEPTAKKPKTVDSQRLELFGKYKDLKNGELDDILRWNHQTLAGTKDVKIAKCIDGEMYGRLQLCTLCGGGRLKLVEQADGTEIVECTGKYDEDLHTRFQCNYNSRPGEAPRWQPWYFEEPSQEEKDAMEAQIEEMTGGDDKKKSAADPDVAKLVAAVSDNNMEWNLNSKKGLQTAVAKLTELLTTSSKDDTKTVDLPDDAATAKMKVGQVVARHRDKSSAAELIPLLVQEFGFVQDKEAKAAKKEAMMENVVQCPANAALVTALGELAELYFKEGNRNAGAAYTKVVNAIKDLDFAITAENAISLSKGKTKVPNIGKSSAEKMKEFCETGTIAKLEEKRADAA